MPRALIVPGLALLLAPAYAATASRLVDHDVFVMAEVARQVLDGRTLYETAWDNKPPLALMSYALPVGILRGSYPAVQLGMWTLVTLQAMLLWSWLDHRPPWQRGAAAILALLMPLQRFAFSWSSSEDVANLLALPMILGGFRIASGRGIRGPDCLLMGLSLVLAFHARQPTAAFAALPVLAILGAPEPPVAKARGALWGLAGLALGAALMAALLLAVADWRGYLHTVFEAPRSYKGHHWNAIEGIFAARGTTLVFLLFASTAALIADGPVRLRMFFLALPAAALLTVLAPMKPFEHYWEQLGPALCLMVPEAIDRIAPSRLRRAVLAGVLGYFGLNAALTAGYLGLVNSSLEGGGAPREPLDRVVAVIEAAADEGDTLFAVGPFSSYLHFASDRPPAHTFFWEMFLTHDLVALSGANRDAVLDAYLARPPDLLAVQSDAADRALAGGAALGNPKFDAFLVALLEAGSYEIIARVEYYTVLRRRLGDDSVGAITRRGSAK